MTMKKTAKKSALPKRNGAANGTPPMPIPPPKTSLRDLPVRKGYRDWTNFWNEWEQTCAIDLCHDEHVKDVHRAMDSYYRWLVSYRARPKPLEKVSRKGKNDPSGAESKENDCHPSTIGDDELFDSASLAKSSDDDGGATGCDFDGGKGPSHDFAGSKDFFSSDDDLPDMSLKSSKPIVDVGFEGTLLPPLGPKDHGWYFIESYLYGGGPNGGEAVNKTTGMAMKRYLFEKVAPGSVSESAHLFGYLKRILRDIATRAENWTYVSTPPPKDEDGAPRERFVEPAPDMLVFDFEGLFRKQMAAQWKTYDPVDKVMVFCLVFEMSANDADVVDLLKDFGIGTSAAYERRKKFQRWFANFIVENGADSEKRTLPSGSAEMIYGCIEQLARKDRDCRKFMKIFDEKSKDHRKNIRKASYEG